MLRRNRKARGPQRPEIGGDLFAALDGRLNDRPGDDAVTGREPLAYAVQEARSGKEPINESVGGAIGGSLDTVDKEPRCDRGVREGVPPWSRTPRRGGRRL